MYVYGLKVRFCNFTETKNITYETYYDMCKIAILHIAMRLISDILYYRKLQKMSF